MVVSLIRRWFKRRRTRAQAAEEEEFFRAWDEHGVWDVDPRIGEQYEPTWDASTGEWVYRNRRVRGEPPAGD